MSNENILPEGTYRAKAIEAQLGETNSGSEQVAISFNIITPGFEWARPAYYGTFGEKALPITIKALRACGWAGLDLSDLSGVTANEVNLVIIHEEYPVGSGNFTAKVKWVNDGSGGLLKKQLDPASAKSFAQRMRGAIAGIDAGAPKAAPPVQRQAPKPAARPEPPPHTDSDAPHGDDIPF